MLQDGMGDRRAEFAATFERLRARMLAARLRNHAVRAETDATLQHVQRYRTARQGSVFAPPSSAGSTCT
jgi:hypothetical protein